MEFTFCLEDAGVVSIRYKIRGAKRGRPAGRAWADLVEVLCHDEAQRYIGPFMERKSGDVTAFGLIEKDWEAVKARLKRWAEIHGGDMTELHVACFDLSATPAWARSGQPDTRMKGGE